MLVAADLHLTDKSDDEYRWGIFEVLTKLARQHKQSRIVLLGDLTDSKDRHTSALVNRVVRSVVKLAKVAPVSILAGNHDYVESAVPFFQFLKHLPQVQFHTKPGSIEPGVVALPHTRTFDEMVSANKKLIASAHVVFMHQTVAGVPVQGIELAGIEMAGYIKAKQLWVSGDIHIPQEFKKVLYCGAPYQVRFGDAYSPRVLLVRPDGRWDSISTAKMFPRRLSLTVTRSGDVAKLGNVRKGDQVKVKFVVTTETISTWREERQKILDVLQSLGAVLGGLVVDARQLGEGVSAGDAVESKRLQRLVSDPITAVKHYCKIRKVESQTAELGVRLVGGETVRHGRD